MLGKNIEMLRLSYWMRVIFWRKLWLRRWKELWTLHDTGIYVPSRDDNRSIGQSTVICTGWQIGDCDHWSTDWRLWPLVDRLETVTSSFLIGDRDCALSDWRQIGVSFSWVYQRGKMPPHFWEGHSVNSFGIHIGLERSASRMAWVEHQVVHGWELRSWIWFILDVTEVIEW